MLTKKELITAVNNGILDANKFYEKISQGFWLSDSAVESIMQCKIAEAIYKCNKNVFNDDGHSIVFEAHIGEIIEKSREKKLRGRVSALIGGAKRIDLTVFNEDYEPVIIIEIKRNVASESFANDADRIIDVLRKTDTLSGGSVKYGVICGFLFGKGGSKAEAIDDRNNKFRKSIEFLGVRSLRPYIEYYKEESEAEEFFDEDDESVWWAGGSMTVYLRRPGD